MNSQSYVFGKKKEQTRKKKKIEKREKKKMKKGEKEKKRKSEVIEKYNIFCIFLEKLFA